MLLAVRLGLCLLSVSALAATSSGGLSAATREVAHPVVRGSAGPFAQVTVTLTRSAEPDGAPFRGELRAGRRVMALTGPGEPAGFFIIEPRAVLFTPVDRSRRNGVVVLYRSSQVGPGHGTEHRALVYRVEPTRAVRLPAVERQLEGARDTVTARKRLQAMVSAAY